MDNVECRKLLSTAFEPCDGGYLYYRNRWAGGVRVSAEEREKFISSDTPQMAFQLGRELSKRAPVAPPRRPSPWLVADAIPYSFATGLIATSLAVAAEAERANPLLPASLLWGVAVFMAGCALTLAARRFIRGKPNVRR